MAHLNVTKAKVGGSHYKLGYNGKYHFSAKHSDGSRDTKEVMPTKIEKSIRRNHENVGMAKHNALMKRIKNVKAYGEK